MLRIGLIFIQMLPNLFLVIFVVQPAFNLPQKQPLDAHSLTSLLHREIIPIAIRKDVRKKKGINLAYPLPVRHHLLLPSQLHVLPATSNVHHSSVHTGVQHIVSSNGLSPVYSQTVSHSSTNITHPTQLVPILVPIQHNLIPQHNIVSQHNLHNSVSQQNLVQHTVQHNFSPQIFHDLSVIPLHRAQKYSQLRAMEKQAEDREDFNVNRFRTFYGGYGNGLYFGGHGAGHGFYAYGK